MLGDGNFRRNNTTWQSYLKIIIIIFYFIFQKIKAKKQNKTSYVVKPQGAAGCVSIVSKYRGFFSFVAAPCSLFFKSFFRNRLLARQLSSAGAAVRIYVTLVSTFSTLVYKVKRHHGTSIRLYLVCIYVPLYINIKCARCGKDSRKSKY